MVDLPAPLPPPIQRMCRSRSGDMSGSREYRVTCVPYHPGNCEPARESLRVPFSKPLVLRSQAMKVKPTYSELATAVRTQEGEMLVIYTACFPSILSPGTRVDMR